MRILIYGAGAVGQALGCLLAGQGHEISLLLRPRFKEAIERDGLSLGGLYGKYHVAAADLCLYTDIDQIPADRTFDYAVISTKTYDTEKASRSLGSFAQQQFTVVTMQNGCGNLEILQRFFDAERILAARIITGFEISAPGSVTITVSADAVRIGGITDGITPESASRLAALIDQAGLPCRATPHIRRHLLAKLLYNCALNPLGAILGVHYGALADQQDTRLVMDRIIAETFAVITAMGSETLWPTPAEYMDFFYNNQVPATYRHRPSMLQDLEQGKPTEIDALTGYVSKMGAEHGIATPVCDTLSALVRFKERQHRV